MQNLAEKGRVEDKGLNGSAIRTRCIMSADCCSAVFIGTKRIDGRLTALKVLTIIRPETLVLGRTEAVGTSLGKMQGDRATP